MSPYLRIFDPAETTNLPTPEKIDEALSQQTPVEPDTREPGREMIHKLLYSQFPIVKFP